MARTIDEFLKIVLAMQDLKFHLLNGIWLQDHQSMHVTVL